MRTQRLPPYRVTVSVPVLQNGQLHHWNEPLFWPRVNPAEMVCSIVRTLGHGQHPNRSLDISVFEDITVWQLDLDKPGEVLKAQPAYPATNYERCPLYRKLRSGQRARLLLRAPKPAHPPDLLDGVLKYYGGHNRRGISPFTAMAVLCPASFCVWKRRDPSPCWVEPQPLHFYGMREQRFVCRRTEPWHVLVWALKKYAPLSWSDIRSLHQKVNRPATSLRATIRRMVEEPLAGYYGNLTGWEPDEDLYSSGLSDASEAGSYARERMRELKRLAHARPRSPIPKK